MSGLAFQQQTLPLAYHEDSAVYFTLIRSLGHGVWLDSGFPTSEYARYDILSAAPAVTLTTRGDRTKITTPDGTIYSTQNPFELVKEYLGELKSGLISDDVNLPFAGGAIGYFGYDLARRLEKLPATASADIPLPDLYVGIYPWAIIQDHHRKTAYLVCNPTLAPSYNFLAIAELCEETGKNKEFHESRNYFNRVINSLKINKFESNIKVISYIDSIKKIQAYIAAGDCYQINFAQRFEATYEGDPLHAFFHLRQKLPSPFSGFMEFENQAIVSISPERFIKIDNGAVSTQPIKGTVARGATPEEDQRNADWLNTSAKNRAENVMIVDLLRNDLSKQCDDVQVPKLCELQSFANVHHLVSTVTGRLRDGSHPVDVLKDAFPGGSITGAPKIRAMEIIEELEPSRRSIYCGSLGYISAHGAMDTSIAIRTLSFANGKAHVWGGGGITADSDPQEEYQETLAKVSKIMRSLEEQFSPQ
ncbi:MAG: aminodeoxychorismate synthase component I [Cellvibrio sp.]